MDAGTNCRAQLKRRRPDGDVAPTKRVRQQPEPQQEAAARDFACVAERELYEANGRREAGIRPAEPDPECPRERLPAVSERAHARTRHVP